MAYGAYPLNVTVDAGNVSVVRIVSVSDTVIGSGISVTIKVVESIMVLLHESVAEQHAPTPRKAPVRAILRQETRNESSTTREAQVRVEVVQQSSP